MEKEILVLLEHEENVLTDLSYTMLTAGKQLANIYGAGLSALILGHNLSGINNNLAADRILLLDHPALEHFTQDAYQQSLIPIIKQRKPLAVLFGNTTVGSDLAGGISMYLNLVLINSGKVFTPEGHVISQICGGKVLVESEIPDEKTIIITMIPGGYKPDEGKTETVPPVERLIPPEYTDLKINVKEIITPSKSDVDISAENILVSVGRGIQTQDNIEMAENLANVLGGCVCASRPIIDQGWLPDDRLVGKSGKIVHPRLYMAIGISGAPEHTEAIIGSEIIMAINTDPSAPIFNIANYGTETDLFDLIEILTEKIEEAKG